MRFAFAAALLLSAAPALGQASFAVDPAQSTITYHLIHKMHKVDGTSKKVEGKAAIADGGRAQVQVRVPAESFDSGNVNRDAHMKEAVEAARFPVIELKAMAEALALPASFPQAVQKSFKVQLLFHGEKGVFEVPVDVVFESADRVRATTRFKVSLDAYKVERPSLMFVKVDDQLELEAKIVFTKAR